MVEQTYALWPLPVENDQKVGAGRLADGQLAFDHHAQGVDRLEAQALTPGEFNLLAALAKSPDRVLSRDRLIDAISKNDDPSDRAIDIIVSRLRKKIEKNPKKTPSDPYHHRVRIQAGREGVLTRAMTECMSLAKRQSRRGGKSRGR